MAHHIVPSYITNYSKVAHSLHRRRPCAYIRIPASLLRYPSSEFFNFQNKQSWQTNLNPPLPNKQVMLMVMPVLEMVLLKPAQRNLAVFQVRKQNFSIYRDIRKKVNFQYLCLSIVGLLHSILTVVQRLVNSLA